MVDMAHIAGFCCTNLHQNPVPYAHVVTSTTHKTLRGPRGGIILSNDVELGKKIDKVVFPETQGGPLEHIIAAKAVCFYEDLQPAYKEYMKQVKANAQAIANVFMENGVKVITNGTDNHLLLVDVKSSFGITGLKAQTTLEEINITLNKNSIPGDTERPAYCSGIRIGSPAMTTRGFKEEEFKQIGHYIIEALRNVDSVEIKEKIKASISQLLNKFPLNYELD
jgi:glycine hydroxymethyltransferase